MSTRIFVSVRPLHTGQIRLRETNLLSEKLKTPIVANRGFQEKLPEGHSLPKGKLIKSCHPDYHAPNVLLAHGCTVALVLSTGN